MELTKARYGYAVVYVILLCALAQGGQEGKREKDDEFSKDGLALSLSSLHIHGYQAEVVWKHCRKELIERNNEVKDFYLHPLEGSSDIRSFLLIENNIHKATKSLPPKMKTNFLDCIRTSSPPVPVSEVKAGSRYLLAKHSSSSFGLTNDHGRNLISESPHNQLPPSPSTVPSPGPAVESPSHAPSPDSSTPSPTLDDSADDFSLPPDMFVPFPPPPPQPQPPSSEIFQPLVYAPNLPHPNNDDKQKKTIIVAVAAGVAGIIALIGLFLCCREFKNNKIDKDDRPLLILTSRDYSGGSQKVIRLGHANMENSGVNNGKDPSNVRSWSIKAKDNNNSLVETTSSEGMGQIPAPPPPGPPPPPPPRPPALAPRPPPPPRAAHPPPAPPKPMKGRNQLAPLRPKESNSSEGGESDAPKPKLKPFFWDKVAAKPDQSMVWHEINAGSFQFNEEKMESLFGCTNQNRNERRKDSPSVDTSVHYIQIIDPKKAQNLSILLRALNVTTEEVIDALKEGDSLSL